MIDIDKLQSMIDECKNIVFFGGAGTSTDSGIKDFRSSDGLYNEKSEYSAEYMLSHDCFFKHTDLFYEYYKKNLNCIGIKPVNTHKYLKKLEDIGKLSCIITQNIDGLHTIAGNKKVYEIHGSVLRNHCLECNKFYDGEYVFKSKGIPKCSCGGIIKPDVVLYGEMLPECFDDAIKEIDKADMMIVAGTSLLVEPAASLVRLFRGKYLVIINNDKTPYDQLANLVIHENINKVFSELK